MEEKTTEDLSQFDQCTKKRILDLKRMYDKAKEEQDFQRMVSIKGMLWSSWKVHVN